tara:strand:+ start:639 stop:830 length:192 start_codon:yes stop_codon:yes gene_type:complete
MSFWLEKSARSISGWSLRLKLSVNSLFLVAQNGHIKKMMASGECYRQEKTHMTSFHQKIGASC